MAPMRVKWEMHTPRLGREVRFATGVSATGTGGTRREQNSNDGDVRTAFSGTKPDLIYSRDQGYYRTER